MGQVTKTVTEQADGTLSLVLRDERGAAEVIVMTWSAPNSDVVHTTGVLQVHYRYPRSAEDAPIPCPVFGWCYGTETAFRAGHEAAESWAAGHKDLAWYVLADWHESRFGEISALHL